MRRRHHVRPPGVAVQVVTDETMLKAPGTTCSKLKYDDSLSNLGFNCNSRRYPLVRNGCADGSKNVGIAGIGGLGRVAQLEPRVNPGRPCLVSAFDT